MQFEYIVLTLIKGDFMVYSNSNFKIKITEKEKEGLIKNFKIGILCQLHKEGYFTSEQLNELIKEINK
jgi:hypothetical protein